MKREITISRNSKLGASILVSSTNIDDLIDTLEQEGMHIDRKRSRKQITPKGKIDNVPLVWRRESANVDSYLLRGESLVVRIRPYINSVGGKYQGWRTGRYLGPARTYVGVKCEVEAPEDLCNRACEVLKDFYERDLQQIRDAGK